MLAEIFFWAIVIYLVYKVVFGFIMPISQSGKEMHRQFRNMNEQMRQQPDNFRQRSEQPNHSQPKSKNKVGDYIDFEEVKK